MLDASNHRAVQELLPWFVADTLDQDERNLVQEHLHLCVQCQSDVAWQRKLKASEPQGDAAPDLERALARLLPRLDAQPAQVRRGILSGFFQSLIPLNGNGMRWALAAQMAVIAGLSILLLAPDRSSPAYHVLGLPKGAASNVVVVFKPETTEQELRRILHASSARVVDGPTVTDAYLLEVADAKQGQAVERLRAEPAVVLAESLDAGAGH